MIKSCRGSGWGQAMETLFFLGPFSPGPLRVSPGAHQWGAVGCRGRMWSGTAPERPQVGELNPGFSQPEAKVGCRGALAHQPGRRRPQNPRTGPSLSLVNRAHSLLSTPKELEKNPFLWIWDQEKEKPPLLVKSRAPCLPLRPPRRCPLHAPLHGLSAPPAPLLSLHARAPGPFHSLAQQPPESPTPVPRNAHLPPPLLLAHCPLCP